jgi:hypothetical protein
MPGRAETPLAAPFTTARRRRRTPSQFGREPVLDLHGERGADARERKHHEGELAWLWVRHQPDSALARRFRERVGAETGRVRRIAIVALARKLLWRSTDASPGVCLLRSTRGHKARRPRADMPRLDCMIVRCHKA